MQNNLIEERMDYYHIPEKFKDYELIEKKLIFTRYKFASNYINKNTQVLEVGCAYGSGSKLIKDVGGEYKSYKGIDISLETIKIAKKEYAEFGDFFESDAENLSLFNENTFDIVICFENIEHVKNPRNSLHEIFRVLKKEGLLVLSTPNRKNWGVADNNLFHYRHYTYHQIISEAEECGFNILKSSGVYFAPSNFKLSSLMSKVRINISKIINNNMAILWFFFMLGKLFPKRSRLLLFVFKKRENYPLAKYQNISNYK
jgi:ubiquinone/menaquinone biosynthesis C-methylase UbiE